VKAFRNGAVVKEFVGAQSPVSVGLFLDELLGPSPSQRLLDELQESGELPEILGPLQRRLRRVLNGCWEARAPIGTARAHSRIMVALFGELGVNDPVATHTGADWQQPLLIRPWRRSAPAADEAQAVTDLVIACDIHDLGAPDFELDDLLTDWSMPGFDLSRDAVVVEEDSALAAYTVFIRNDYVDVYVSPARRDLGLGAKLLDWAERRAVERAGAGALLGQVVNSTNDGARASPGRPRLPAGADVLADVDGARRAAAARLARACSCAPSTRSGTRGVFALVRTPSPTTSATRPSPSRSGRRSMIDREAFEPGLWFIAESKGEIVGAVICPSYEDEGWVRQLAVSRDWRRRGLGTALLRQAMSEFSRRGRRELGLVVDSWNRTGAKDLYERAGMTVAREHVRYEKTLAS
jgi:ribosomal protein S18 acetylase RimI-like enzyme